jgi:single-strand DNA-binding protein
MASLRIATSETWRDKASGERKEKTEWHSVSIMNDALVKVAEQYLRKGSKVYLEGQLETRKWQDQSGADRYSTEVVLRPFNSTLTLLDGKPAGDDTPPRDYADERKPEPGGRAGDMGDGGDIPF